MNAKQRVHAALRREPVDRVPIFMWFHPETTRRLAALLDIPAARVADALGNDVAMTGEKALFEDLATKNIQTFNEKGIKKIITLSPHSP